MNQKAKQIILLVALFILSAFIGVYIASSGVMNNLGLLELIVFFFSIIISYFLVVNIHELGHLFCGKAVGYKLYMYKAWRFYYKNINGKFKFGWEKNEKGYAGFCMMIPPNRELTMSQNLLCYSGGILANLTTGALALVINETIAFLPGYLKIFLYVFGILSLLIGFTNLVPCMSGNNPTDGKVIWSIITRNDFAQYFVELSQIQQKMLSGIRPRDIAELEEDFDENEPLKESFFISKYLLVLFNAIDNQDKERIRKCLMLIENNIKDIPSLIAPSFKYELCYSYCILEDRELAKKYYSEIESTIKNDNDLNACRVKAYHALYVLNDADLARNYCNEALSVADKFPLKGQTLMETDLVDKLIKILPEA